MNVAISISLWLIFFTQMLGCFSQPATQEPADISAKILSLVDDVDCEVESEKNTDICQSKSTIVEPIVLVPPMVSRPAIVDFPNPISGSQGGSSLVRMGNPDTNDDDEGFDCRTLVCNDDNFCTTDSCNRANGCQFTAISDGPSTSSCTAIDPMTNLAYPPVCAAGFRLCENGLPTQSNQTPPESDLNYCLPAILPGANFEICLNNIDDDCDGLTDEDDTISSQPPPLTEDGCVSN